MRGLIFNMAVMAVLGMGAISIPGQMGKKVLVSQANGLMDAANKRYEQMGMPVEKTEIPSTLEGMTAQFSRQYNSLNEEERQMLLESRPELQVVMTNPLLKKMLTVNRDAGAEAVKGAVSAQRKFAADKAVTDFRNFYNRHQSRLRTLGWLVPGGLLLVSALLLLFSCYEAARFGAGLVFNLSVMALFIYSAGMVFFHMALSQNFLLVMPQDFLMMPVVFLFLGAFVMKLVDMNFPFWNKTVWALASPMICAVVVFGWQQSLGWAVKTVKSVV